MSYLCPCCILLKLFPIYVRVVYYWSFFLAIYNYICFLCGLWSPVVPRVCVFIRSLSRLFKFWLWQPSIKLLRQITINVKLRVRDGTGAEGISKSRAGANNNSSLPFLLTMLLIYVFFWTIYQNNTFCFLLIDTVASLLFNKVIFKWSTLFYLMQYANLVISQFRKEI